MDLTSASAENLELLPETSSRQRFSSEKDEKLKEWLEDMMEKAGRGRLEEDQYQHYVMSTKDE